MVTITRRFAFAAAHRLADARLDEAANREKFGRCAGRHGHNYELAVTLSGKFDEREGMFVNFEEVARVVRERVLDVLDHRDLTADVEWFRERPATSENIARFAWQALDRAFPAGCRLERVRVSETADSWVDYDGI